MSASLALPPRIIPRFAEQTAASKLARSRFGRYLADPRAAAGYRPALNEILYPIVGDEAEGAFVRDIDGNTYIDFTMGFGVQLFGHRPPFLREALADAARMGFALGPLARDAGEVARHLCEMTGMQRAHFCNSGTEAVMAALRLARAVTGRPRVVTFWGSYHGWYDTTLGRPRLGRRNGSPPAGAPGVSAGALSESLILGYGDARALETIAAQAGEIAAVLVEPVQARNLSLQPADFLARLRELTEREGITLIFDDVLLGFRIGAQGSQGWFGIRADIATYGKALGGGLPIGVVAGDRRFMDAVDGGFHPFGDTVSPRTATTFLPGTFNKHPLTMRLAASVLDRLSTAGPGLQRDIADRCGSFAERLNSFFRSQSLPIEVVRFASIFRFTMPARLELFYYYLICSGLYLWEGRTCFLSEAHDDQVLNEAFARVGVAVAAMRTDGVL